MKDEEFVDLSERVKMCSEFKHAINCEELRKLIEYGEYRGYLSGP